MEYFEITGGTPLHGSITLQGSKNAALPLMAASILHPGRTTLHHVPAIRDVDVMIEILENIGCTVQKDKGTLIIDAAKAEHFEIAASLGERMRSTIILLGSMLGRAGRAKMPFPGGCIIGMRPIDIHITSLGKMGAVFEETDGMLCAETDGLCGTRIHLRFPSVGATENVILAAVYARGRTRIENCAKEPEIAELCRFLREKGAKIEGEGTSCILVEGVSHLRDSTYTLMPDRIVAGTYLFAAAATRGEICLEGMRPSDMESVLDVLGRMGAVYENREDGFYLDGRKAINPLPVVCTETYPGFPTDLQSQLLATLCVARGRSVIRECIFEERFRIAPWLNRMGADVTTDGREAVIEGKAHLSGQMVKAQELRGGAALVIAALMAQGITRVYGSAFIERGYEDLAGDLRKLGAVISKKKAER
ncbi:UDP-N-acetylglucosamine 1-carboxyvinyltransferase [Lachnospiraceae bacterium CLA-AA-H246]|uniref:UDP-N-acetylglucosamine 1-carboxyvinyltransferase n=1 Tax=Hominisplanchenecus faecis TaxID=2885351 RepID=A0ABS8EWI9_9FIRM|nr:UDP-N-acetylglucosamine 1-carboxyvinyltransferase [Hominisplanchenecus faecis]